MLTATNGRKMKSFPVQSPSLSADHPEWYRCLATPSEQFSFYSVNLCIFNGLTVFCFSNKNSQLKIRLIFFGDYTRYRSSILQVTIPLTLLCQCTDSAIKQLRSGSTLITNNNWLTVNSGIRDHVFGKE